MGEISNKLKGDKMSKNKCDHSNLVMVCTDEKSSYRCNSCGLHSQTFSSPFAALINFQNKAITAENKELVADVVEVDTIENTVNTVIMVVMTLFVSVMFVKLIDAIASGAIKLF